MRRLLMPLLALLLLSAPACGDSTTTFIGGGGDASGGDTNTGGDEDASPAEDAGVAEDAGAGEDAAAVGTPGDDELVWIYEQTPVFFSGWEEGQNQRQVDVTVTLPGEEFTYESIEFAFALGCPNGDRCDSGIASGPWASCRTQGRRRSTSSSPATSRPTASPRTGRPTSRTSARC